MKIMTRIHAAIVLAMVLPLTSGRVADRSRVVKHRQDTGKVAQYQDNGRPIEGQSYRSLRDKDSASLSRDSIDDTQDTYSNTGTLLQQSPTEESDFERELSSQLSGCCYDYQKYSASSLCYLYGNDCESGETPSHDSGDGDCEQEGLSFIGISFSVNTASGNPYSYQLCDQFPMENIIDRDYEYVMSMDEDGWLVGGGYKQFDYSGKMP